MKIYSKTIYLHNIKINFNCDYFPVFNLFCEQLKFPKFRRYNDYIEIEINLSLQNNIFEDGRADISDLKANNFSLDCWIKNISLQLNAKKNSINARLIYPSNLNMENLLHLIIISPLRRILQYRHIFLIHAAVVSRANKVLLISGGPGRGKSTLAAAFLLEGYKFLSDEFAIVRGDEILSFPLKIKLDKKSLQALKLNKNKKFNRSFHAPDYFPLMQKGHFSNTITLFIRPSNKASIPLVLKSLNKEEAFALLACDKVNSLPEEKNILVRRRQIQALSRLAQKTKTYAVSYSLSQAKQIPELINNLL